MRYGAPRIGRPRRHNTMIDQQAVESELGSVSHRKNSLSIASRGARRLGTLPKSCHLLPFCSRNTATAVSTLAFVALSRACRSACHWSLLVRHWSLVPGYSFLRVVQIAARSLQDCKALEADLFPGESARYSRISQGARSGCTPSCPGGSLRLTSRTVGCAFSSRFVGWRAPDPCGFDRHNTLKIGDLGPIDCLADDGEMAPETLPELPFSAK
jgi:hypothetical protein